MNAQHASKLIEDVVNSAILCVGEAAKNGKVSKRTIVEADRAVTRLFRNLVGRDPTAEELAKITD